jgi:[protein-PII] uridylyltransferase
MHIQDNRFKSNQREKVLKNKKSNRQPDTEQTKPELKGVSDNDKLTLKQQIIDFDEQLQLNFATSQIEELLERKADFIDKLLTELWQASGIASDNFSINAVGGYGRKTLHPHSDIDLCIIHENALKKEEVSSLEAFIAHLWDLGLNLGQSVRSLDEHEKACRLDITIATNLLDIRYIAGNQNHARHLLSKLFSDELWTNENFFEGKYSEQKNRHQKLENKTFKLEPNLKKSPGGMRDIQTLQWVSQKKLGTSDLKAIRAQGFFSVDEYSELQEAQSFIWRVRWALHKVAKRDENRLLIEYQPDVARLLGFGGSGNLATEKMMRQLFRAMKRVRELNQMLMLFHKRDLNMSHQNASGSRLTINTTVINNNFEVMDGLIQARSDDVFVYRKEMLSMFRHIAQSSVEITGIAPETLRLLRQSRRRLLGDLQDFVECRKEFLSIFNNAPRMELALSLMHLHGVLNSYLPQWREIVGQMQFDLFHAYTVDEHTYRVVTNLIRFNQKQSDDNLSLVANVFRKFDKKACVYFAALFHDIAKGRGGDHSELGAIDARQFSSFHELKQSDSRLISWLVGNHLAMSITSQRMDIDDPAIINNFAKQVGTKERLDALYCLTVADIKATNEALWNGWKASLLEKLYFSTKKALLAGLENIFEIRDKVKENKREALLLLEKMPSNIDKNTIESLWKRLPLIFFNNAKPKEIAYFTDKIIALKDDECLIEIHNDDDYDCSRVFVYMKDRVGLFSDIFATLATLNISINDAQISQTKDGFVIETLKVLDFDDKPLQDEFRRETVKQQLHQCVNETNVRLRLSPPKHIDTFENKPSIEYLNSRKMNRTLISITALDNPNFMDKICHCFRQLDLNIHSAKISTMGESVDNVFLVSSGQGEKMSNQQQQQLKALLVTSITD